MLHLGKCNRFFVHCPIRVKCCLLWLLVSSFTLGEHSNKQNCQEKHEEKRNSTICETHLEENKRKNKRVMEQKVS